MVSTSIFIFLSYLTIVQGQQFLQLQIVRARHLQKTVRDGHNPQTTRVENLPRTTRAGHIPQTTRVEQLSQTVRAEHLPQSVRAGHTSQTVRLGPPLPKTKATSPDLQEDVENKVHNKEKIYASARRVKRTTGELTFTDKPHTTSTLSLLRNFTRKQLSHRDGIQKRQSDHGYDARSQRMGKRRNRKRKKRYQYEDTYDWDYEGGALDYELDEKSEVEKFLEEWHVAGMKMVGYLSVLLFIGCTFCCMCRTGCGFICNGCISNCVSCYDALLCRDQMYRRFCRFAGPFGLKLSYSEYLKIKQHYTEYAKEHHGVDVKF